MSNEIQFEEENKTRETFLGVMIGVVFLICYGFFGFFVAIICDLFLIKNDILISIVHILWLFILMYIIWKYAFYEKRKYIALGIVVGILLIIFVGLVYISGKF